MNWFVPTIAPSFILYGNRRYEGVMLHDMSRAIGLARGSWKPNWSEDEFVIRPTADQVVDILKQMEGSPVGWDIETNGEHPLSPRGRVRCIGFYCKAKKLAVCVPLIFRDGTHEEYIDEKTGKTKRRARWVDFYVGSAKAKVLAAIRKLLTSTRTKLRSQNGQYDRLYVKCKLGIEVQNVNSFDSILGHHLVASYLPHGLDFIGSLYTDVEYYKETDDGEAWSSASDVQLWIYCLRDCKVTDIACEKIEAEVHERPEDIALYEHDKWREKMAMAWKEAGILVDVEAAELLSQYYQAMAAKALEAMRKIVGNQLGAHQGFSAKGENEYFDQLLELLTGKADEKHVTVEGNVEEFFNPGSLRQLRRLLLGLGIPLTEETATGDISTAKDFLLAARKELLNKGIDKNDDRIAILDYLFGFREAKKTDSTYLHPELMPDGRVHPTYNVHVVPTGRGSGSDPGIHQQPGEIRGIYVPHGYGDANTPKHVLVKCDWDSGEMRLGALMSGDKTFIKEFEDYDAGKGFKIHIMNASAIFGLPATADFEKKYPGCYRASKVFAYAVAYGAGEDTVFDKVREEMPDMEWNAFKQCYANYKKKRATLFEFQAEVVRKGTQQHYLDSEILKRRVYFYETSFGEDSPEASAMQNMPYQSGLADVVQLANRRMEDEVVLKKYLKKLRPGEVLRQLTEVHDELMYEVPERLAEAFMKDMKKVCDAPPDLKHSHWAGKLPVAPEIVTRWKPIIWPCHACGTKVKFERVKPGIWAGTCEKCDSITYRSLTGTPTPSNVTSLKYKKLQKEAAKKAS